MSMPPEHSPPARKSTLPALLGGLLLVGLVVFWIMRSMVPNIVGAGRRTSEEGAVSRLRELLWAEDMIRAANSIDRDGDGRGEYAFLGDLMGQGEARLANPPLQPGRFRQVSPGVYRGEGYGFVVYLPTRGGGATLEGGAAMIDPARARDRWIAYAFPLEGPGAGRRLFFIDQDERICEADLRGGSDLGPAGIPPWNAALPPGAGLLDAISACGPGADGRVFRPWRHKKARPPRPATTP